MKTPSIDRIAHDLKLFREYWDTDALVSAAEFEAGDVDERIVRMADEGRWLSMITDEDEYERDAQAIQAARQRLAAVRAAGAGGDEMSRSTTVRTRRQMGQYPTIVHRDGTVTYWSVYEQRWVVRAARVPDDDYAALPREDRERIERVQGPRA